MNILPTLASRWQLVNCTYSSLSFTFSAAGSARVDLTDTDIKSFSAGTLSAIVLPEALTLPTDVRCHIFIRVGQVYTCFDCFLLANTAGLYSALLDLITGTYDEAYVQLTTTGACSVNQLSLDIVTQDYDEIIEELRGELPKLLEDYNTYDMVLTTEEVTVGLITANLLENTDLQGHFSLSFLASNKAEIVMRVYDDQRKCLYSPSIISVNAGKHTISFPHSYLKSSIGYHNFYVTLQATEGNVKIPTRAMLYTIDGAHMAERLLDSFYMINDITAKTQISSVEPTLLYTVGVVDNIATIRHIAPNEIGLSNWIVDFFIENVKEAAIEFDGSWIPGVTRRMFVTNDVPVLFYTDMSNVLWTQVFDSVSRTQLATDVVKVSAVRGWRYIDALVANDTGLIVAYIKADGKAYYRQYINIPGDTPYWSSEDQLLFEEVVEPLVDISCGRLNDYRLSFTVEDSEGNGSTLITKRYYQGDAVENVTLQVKAANVGIGWSEIITIEVTEIWNISNTETFVRFNYPMVDYVGKQASFILRDVNNVNKTIISTEKFDDYTIKLNHNNIGGFVPPLRVIFTNSDTGGINGPLITEHGSTTFAVPSFNIPFDAIDFSPKGYGTETVQVAGANVSVVLTPISELKGYSGENVEVAGADVSLTLIEVTYKRGYNGIETVGVAGANIALVLTQVGIDPL